jgi:hypothetical protein
MTAVTEHANGQTWLAGNPGPPTSPTSFLVLAADPRTAPHGGADLTDR